MKRFYVCTAIAYVNDKPHIGHAMDFLYGDVLARYARQQGLEGVTFSIGTDEHGSKIAEKAQEAKQTEKAFVDANVAEWQEFTKLLNISNNLFARTTDKGHEDRAAIIWKNLEADIYKKAYEGWYCVGCEEYKTETVVKETKGICPLHNRAYDKLSEENYFFKLSKYTEQIKKAIESDELQIVPANKKSEILNVLKEGLEDISISRPIDKISWGIKVPGDTSHVMYVWFEALMNYITVIGYPEQEDFKNLWPADVQIIGKDILRFHAAIWPGMLLGLGLPLPRSLLVHGHVTSSGQKMSKTIGNVIDPMELMKKYGPDAFRYFLLRHIPSTDDGDYSPERFEAAYNSELGNELGNAVQRIAVMVKTYQDSVIGNTPESKHDLGPYQQAMADFRFDKALEVVWEQVRGLNQFIDEEKPWVLAKSDDKDNLREILATCVSNLLEIAELLTPLMPDTAAKIQAVFKEGIVRPFEGTLFPRLESHTNKT